MKSRTTDYQPRTVVEKLNDIDLDKLDEPKHIAAFYLWFGELNHPRRVPDIELIEVYIYWLKEHGFTRYHILEFLREIKKDYKNIVISLKNISTKKLLNTINAFKSKKPQPGDRADWMAEYLTNNEHTRQILGTGILGWLDNPKYPLAELKPAYVKKCIDLVEELSKELDEYLDNEIECYNEIEEEIAFRSNEVILKSNKSFSNNMDVISDEIEEYIKSINLKSKVSEFANRAIETNKLVISDKYFVREAKKIFLAEISKETDVRLSKANRESVRTYFSKFKTNYIEVKRKGKGKKK